MPDDKKREITYFVNAEEETTEEAELDVREILEEAGFKPADEWTLKSLDPKEDFDSHYDRKVHIHEGQHFEALHKGPTPTS
jgi:8-oxo-dGTP pyrophosphatase MutT (NUDIX family)